MNESTLTQLQVIVERAVRPVQASISCKRKMREELLAHVSGAFEDELSLPTGPFMSIAAAWTQCLVFFGACAWYPRVCERLRDLPSESRRRHLRLTLWTARCCDSRRGGNRVQPAADTRLPPH